MKYLVIYLALYNGRNHDRCSQCCPEFLSQWQALGKHTILCNFHHVWKDGIKEMEVKRDGGICAGWVKSHQPCWDETLEVRSCIPEIERVQLMVSAKLIWNHCLPNPSQLIFDPHQVHSCSDQGVSQESHLSTRRNKLPFIFLILTTITLFLIIYNCSFITCIYI